MSDLVSIKISDPPKSFSAIATQTVPSVVMSSFVTGATQMFFQWLETTVDTRASAEIATEVWVSLGAAA